MTKKELWHIRIRTRVQTTDPWGNIQKGTVIRRQVEDETYGFMIAREKKTGKITEKDFYTGNKYLTVTVKFDDGSIRYYDTLKPNYRLEDLKFVQE